MDKLWIALMGSFYRGATSLLLRVTRHYLPCGAVGRVATDRLCVGEFLLRSFKRDFHEYRQGGRKG